MRSAALWVWLGLAATSLQGCSGPYREIRGGETNVVLIIIDTLRADHLGAWGYSKGTSPNLDALASTGVRFDRFYSTAPWTRPSVASMISGLYPRSTGVLEERFDRLPDDVELLSERLSSAGYTTLGATSNPNINAVFGFDQGFDSWVDSGALWKWMDKKNRKTADAEGLQDASQITDTMLRLLDERTPEQRKQPFFLQGLYIDPHTPYRAPAEHASLFIGRFQEYDAEIHYADEQIGRLIDALRERDLLSDTLIIVTSDHGEGLNSHPNVPLSAGHGDHLHDSVLHVPLIVWHPSLRPRVIATPTSATDLVPTLADLLGLPPTAEPHPGRSMVPFLRGLPTPGDWPEQTFSETDWKGASKTSVRTGSHRYVYSQDSQEYQDDGAFEGRSLKDPRKKFLELPVELLYRLGAGQFELPERNAIELEPEVAKDLAGRLALWAASTAQREPIHRSNKDVKTLGDGTVVPSVATDPLGAIDEDVVDELKALGYLGDED